MCSCAMRQGCLPDGNAAKAEAAVEMLPQLWEDFCGALNAWRKANL